MMMKKSAKKVVNSMTIGEKIAARRKQLGMTQTDLAVRLGTTKQTIGKYEKGIVTNIPLSRVVELANVLDCTPEYLTGWEEPAPAKQEDDAELLEYLEYLRTRPEARILMSTMRGATKEEVEENVRFIEALRKTRSHD